MEGIYIYIYINNFEKKRMTGGRHVYLKFIRAIKGEAAWSLYVYNGDLSKG